MPAFLEGVVSIPAVGVIARDMQSLDLVGDPI